MYNPVAQEVERLLLELRRRLANIEQKVTQAQQDIAKLWGTAGIGGGSGGDRAVYIMDPTVISAGGSVSGQTVYALISGTPTTVTTTATVYNEMDSATVATTGKTIVLGLNPDGTYLVITQSC